MAFLLIMKFYVIYSYYLPQEIDSLCQHFLPSYGITSVSELISLTSFSASPRDTLVTLHYHSPLSAWASTWNRDLRREGEFRIHPLFRKGRFDIRPLVVKWWWLLGTGTWLEESGAQWSLFFFSKWFVYNGFFFMLLVILYLPYFVCSQVMLIFCMFKVMLMCLFFCVNTLEFIQNWCENSSWLVRRNRWIFIFNSFLKWNLVF